MPPTQPPVSVSQAADRTGISARTIRHAILQGHLPAHKLPGLTAAYLIHPRDLDKWAAKRQPKATA